MKCITALHELGATAELLVQQKALNKAQVVYALWLACIVEPVLLPRQWCGDAAGTTGNIKLMAECIARQAVANKEPFCVGTSVVGSYFDGVGLAGTADLPGFFEYIEDGAVANDVKNRCVEAYRFIVDHMTEDSEVWMLGLSRGAFTLRSVAGMINNFGILDRDKVPLEPIPTDPDAKLDPICSEVYRMYRSRDKQFHPDAPYPAEFKAKYCVNLHGRPAIKFMGLLDTVGSLGVPKVNAGFGLEFLFYDQVVSKEVENVYQALAAHDVFFGFEPCFVRRAHGYSQPGVTREVWFPGAHWDLGRQRFVPFRTTGGWLEKAAHNLLDVTNLLGVNIEPTLECSVEPLKWMLRCMRQTDPSLFDDAGYGEAVHRCLQVPWQDSFPLARRALKKNALETLNERFFRGFSPLFAGLALRDRQIPEYGDANFIGGEAGASNADAFLSPVSGFDSLAFNVYSTLRPAGVIWVPYGQPVAAAAPLEALSCKCGCGGRADPGCAA